MKKSLLYALVSVCMVIRPCFGGSMESGTELNSESLKFSLLFISGLFIAVGIVYTIYFNTRKNRHIKKLESLYFNLPFSFGIVRRNGTISFMHSDSSSPILNLDELKEAGAFYRNAIDEIISSGVKEKCFEYNLGDRRKFAVIKSLPSNGIACEEFVASAIDITPVYQDTQRLKRYIEQEEILNNSLMLLAMNNNHDAIVKNVLEIVRRQTNADRVFVYSFDYANGKILRHPDWNTYDALSPDLLEIPFSVDMDFYKILLRRGILFCGDLGNSPTPELEAFAKIDGMSSTKSITVAGIWRGEKLWGVIGVDYIKNIHAYSELDERMLCAVSNVIGLSAERVENKIELENSEREKDILLKTLDIPAALFDTEMNILAHNTASENIIKSISGKMLTQECPCVLGLAKCMGISCIFRRCIKEKSETFAEININGKDWRVTCRPVFNRESVMTRILCTLVDMTEFKERQRRIEKAMHKEQVANRAKSLFIATMSHEIRTPLNAIIGFK